MIRLPLFRKLRASFRAKVFSFTLAFVVALSIIFPAYFMNYEIKDNREALIKQGMILVNLLAHSARLPVFSGNLAMIDEAADAMLIYQGVLSVAIYDADGHKLIEELTGERHLSPDNNPERQRVVTMVRTLTEAISVEHSGGIEFWAPVRIVPGYVSDEDLYFGTSGTRAPEQTIGVVRLLVDTTEMRQIIRFVIASSAIIALLFICIGAAGAYWAARSVTAPLKRLAAGVTALGREGVLREVPVETGDEVGQVAVAFNGLIESLKRREKEKSFLEEQLRHSQKLEAVGTLAGGIAHDFNTILTAIGGFADLIRKEAGNPDKVRNYVDQVQSSSGKASQLITRLLAFSRKQVLDPRPLDLNTIIRNMEELLRRVVTDQVILELSLTTEPLPVLVDSHQFDQVLLNLAANARDAMPEGGTFRITTQRAAACEPCCEGIAQVHPGWCAVVTVEDTGSGIPDAIREKIFDPFFTTKEVGKGTGLGLSMVYGIIRQHSGSISALGEPGAGATFAICLPGLETGTAESSLPGLTGVHLVVADNDPVNLRRVGYLLRECGATVHEADDGMAALRCCSDNAERVDLVVLNILMEGGKKAYDEIRRLRPLMKFIFIGGLRREGMSPDEDHEAGIATIYRPISREELLGQACRVLGRGTGKTLS